MNPTEAMQQFPMAGQGNLNSTASRADRSRYIRLVMAWWNQYGAAMHDAGLIDATQNPRATEYEHHACELVR